MLVIFPLRLAFESSVVSTIKPLGKINKRKQFSEFLYITIVWHSHLGQSDGTNIWDSLMALTSGIIWSDLHHWVQVRELCKLSVVLCLQGKHIVQLEDIWWEGRDRVHVALVSLVFTVLPRSGTRSDSKVLGWQMNSGTLRSLWAVSLDECPRNFSGYIMGANVVLFFI